MRPRIGGILVFFLGVLLAGGATWAQASPQGSPSDRLQAAARRVTLPQDALAPALQSLARLEADGLPTRRFVDRMVECIAKRSTPEVIRTRAEKLEREIRQARAILEQASSQGFPFPPPDPLTPDPVDEVADALQSSPITSVDLLRVMGYLKTQSLPRILAGADATAHLRRMGLEEGLLRKLLASVKPTLPDAELRAFPSALFTGRRCGKGDSDIVSSLLRHMASGGTPSALAKEWAESPSFRGGTPKNPNWSPGSGEGQGPRWNRDDDSRGGQSGQSGQSGQGGPSGQGGQGRGKGRRGGG